MVGAAGEALAGAVVTVAPQAGMLRPGCRVKREPPLNAGQPGVDFSYLRHEDSWGPAWAYRFRNVLVSPAGVLFKGGKVIPESLDYSRQQRRNAPTFYKKIALGRVDRLRGAAVVAHNAYYINYYHWLTECLPRLYCVRESLRDRELIVCADLKPFHLQSLEYFGLRGVRRLSRDRLMKVDDLLFPGHPYGGYGQHDPSLLKEMAAWFKTAIGAAGRSDTPPRKIFIVRKTEMRRLVNQDEVLDVFQASGYEPVVLEDLSFREQVAMFSEATAVAGVHGAGFSNLLFMKPGSFVFELINEGYRNGCFFNLANAMDLRVTILPCRTAGDADRGLKHLDLAADVGQLKRYHSVYGGSSV